MDLKENIGNLKDRLLGKSIESVKLRDLQSEEMRLKNKVDRIRKDTEDVEKQSKKLFHDGVGADPLKKKMLAQDIKALDTELKLKVRSYSTARGQLAFVKNLITLKKFEKELKNMGLWKKLTSLPTEKVESWLIKLNLDQKDFDQIVEELNKPFEMEVASVEAAEADEREKSLVDAWSQVEAGSMKPEEAEELASSKKALEKEL